MTAAEGYMLAAAVGLAVLAAVAAAAQSALSRMTLTRALKLESEERRGAARLVRLVEDPTRSANILALLVLAAQVTGIALVTVVVTRYLGAGLAVAVAAIAGTVALFVLAEATPKTIGLQHAERVALLTAGLVALVARPLAPLARALIAVANVVVPGKGLATGPFVTEDELREMIDVAEEDEVIEESEREMIHSIFELGDTVAREVMVPRPDMVMVSVDDSLDEVLEVVLEAGHSRVPVYRDDRDRIIGLVYAKDVLRHLHIDGGGKEPWQDWLRPAYFVPELKRLDELLREMQADQVHLAIIVDEYGVTAGLISIEDILEEIVGEIVDEYDREEPLVEPLDAASWRVDGRLPIDELNDLVAARLPDDEWDTVGGLIFGLLGHVPSSGERVEADGVRLTAERIKGRRIAQVLVERLAEPGDADVAEPDPAG